MHIGKSLTYTCLIELYRRFWRSSLSYFLWTQFLQLWWCILIKILTYPNPFELHKCPWRWFCFYLLWTHVLMSKFGYVIWMGFYGAHFVTNLILHGSWSFSRSTSLSRTKVCQVLLIVPQMHPMTQQHIVKSSTQILTYGTWFFKVGLMEFLVGLMKDFFIFLYLTIFFESPNFLKLKPCFSP
jgi:hypothetical protein